MLPFVVVVLEMGEEFVIHDVSVLERPDLAPHSSTSKKRAENIAHLNIPTTIWKPSSGSDY